MTYQNEPPALGAPGAREGCRNSPIDTFPTNESPKKRQVIFAPLQREIAELCFRIAAIKLLHAADNIAVGDDAAAWDDIDVAEARLGEGAGLLREMEEAI